VEGEAIMSVPAAATRNETVTVTELRQFTYCPRVVYFMGMLPRPITGKMHEGKQAHGDEEERERRRSLRPYGLRGGERHYGVRLEDPVLGLRAVLDMVVVGEGEVIPIEHKLSRGPLAATHRVQLMAYGLLGSAAYGLPARRGFVYWIPTRRVSEVSFTPELERHALDLIDTVHAMRRSEALPPPTPVLGRCADCEFRRFCGDRPRAGSR
jgi:CRISPR-associated exonuclease Cas4